MDAWWTLFKREQMHVIFIDEVKKIVKFQRIQLIIAADGLHKWSLAAALLEIPGIHTVYQSENKNTMEIIAVYFSLLLSNYHD